jgi:hypothetical protein
MRPVFLRGKDFSQVQNATPVVRLQSWFKRKLTWDEQVLLLASLYELNQIESNYPYARMMEATLFKSWFFPMKVRLTDSREEAIRASQAAVARAARQKSIRLDFIINAIQLLAKCPDDEAKMHWSEVDRTFRKIQRDYLL